MREDPTPYIEDQLKMANLELMVQRLQYQLQIYEEARS